MNNYPDEIRLACKNNLMPYKQWIKGMKGVKDIIGDTLDPLVEVEEESISVEYTNLQSIANFIFSETYSGYEDYITTFEAMYSYFIDHYIDGEIGIIEMLNMKYPLARMALDYFYI